MKTTKENWKYSLVILWMLLNTYLIANGHQTLSSDVLKIEQVQAQEETCHAAIKP